MSTARRGHPTRPQPETPTGERRFGAVGMSQRDGRRAARALKAITAEDVGWQALG
jgi:hypothetical protein